MFCTNCGEKNKKSAVFCKKCGTRISGEKVESQDTKVDSVQQFEGLNGWLALVGLGLIIAPIIQGYGLFDYFSLLAQEYNIPGYYGLLQFEFFVSIAYIAACCYLLFLYFKKRKNFPKYYIYFLIGSTIYVLADHLWLASLTGPTQELQKVIDDGLAQNAAEVGRAIFQSIIWIAYMKKSKRVKATFIN